MYNKTCNLISNKSKNYEYYNNNILLLIIFVRILSNTHVK